ncbi:hypothetical protein BH09MYX1_BH09MYX1_60560 [soil metagenome]
MNKNVFAKLLLAAPFAIALSACATLLDVDFGAAHNDPDASFPGDGGVGPCQPKSCEAQGFACGTQTNGCGESLECGTCKTGLCTAGKCACIPKTCPQLAVQCGKVDDGCGKIVDCGGCANSADACNAQTNACECKPKDCKAQNAECGSVPDGCGNTYTCGSCASSGAGPYCSSGKCGQAPCVPKTCPQLGKNCGQVSDGCGTILDCGSCSGPQTCGGSGAANVCGCTPKTCPQLGANCGNPPDACGGSLSCGSCASPQTCNGGGTANVCGCTPSGSCSAGSNCGTVPDNCGGNVSCGPACASPNSCGGAGIANRCGCSPLTCADYNCGNGLSNGCGGTINCGSCGGGGCFVASTPVLMADGSMRAIETLVPGDLVMGFDRDSRMASARAVKALAVHDPVDSSGGIVVINDSLRATRNHPFYVGGRAVRAEDLKVGDVMQVAVVDRGHVTLHDRPVTSVFIKPGGAVSYDVKTNPPGGYFVGPDKVVVLIKQIP